MPRPKLLMLHSADTSTAQMRDVVGDTTGFRMFYPRAQNNSRWDHVSPTASNPDVKALLKIDADFIAGYSSGAFMASRMLQEKQYKAAMILCGGILNLYLKPFYTWPYPCPLMLVNGTADARVPYSGNEFYEAGMDAAVALKTKFSLSDPQHFTFPESTPPDGCTGLLDTWDDGADMELKLYTALNGGHVWPGSSSNLPGLGRTCMEFSATEEMLAFFLEHV